METKILQFGEGNFLRCFIDWMVQKMNDKAGFDGAVQIIQPIGDELCVPAKILNDRGGKYHTCLRGINVVYTPDMQPYRTRKVRFLNATHTTMVYRGLEQGFTEVAQCIADPEFNKFVRQVIFDEIFPTVNLPDAEKKEYAESVLERFANPFAHHQLKSIALNTIAKWKTRCLPVVCDYYKLYGKLPAAMIEGYEAIARHYDAIKV